VTNDVIIGAADGYSWQHMKNWALSLAESGFTGRKVLIAYRIDPDTVAQLRRRDIEVVHAQQDHLGRTIDYQSWRRVKALPNRLRRLWRTALGRDFQYVGQNRVFQMRFFHLWQYLAGLDKREYRHVIASDVSDVVFQDNPSTWLSTHLGDRKIVGSSEAIRHDHEPWGRENTKKCFGPFVWDHILKEKPIINAGLVAGELSYVRDLFLQVYLMTYSSLFNNSDQAALNLLLRSRSYEDVLRFTESEDGWVCQAGTVADPTKLSAFRPFLLEPEPRFVEGVAYTSRGTKYSILHQYNRVPAWKIAVDAKYAG
jgi:hypothetical protein